MFHPSLQRLQHLETREKLLEHVKVDQVGVHPSFRVTLPKTNKDPDNGLLDDCFPLPTSGFQGL